MEQLHIRIDNYRKLLIEDPTKAKVLRQEAKKEKNSRFSSLVEMYHTLIPAILESRKSARG